MSDQWPISPSAVALDLLDDQEVAIAEQLLAQDPAFAGAVREQRELTGSLDAMPALMRRPAPPPPLQIRTEPASAPRRRRFTMPALRVALPAAGAVAAASVVVVLAFGGDDAKTPQAPVQQAAATVVLEPVSGGPGTAKLTVSGTKAKLVGSNLPPTPKGKHYEAWLARPDGSMKPMGGFEVGKDGTVEAEMEFREDLSEYAYVDVSVEPNNGVTKRTGASVLRADL